MTLASRRRSIIDWIGVAAVAIGVAVVLAALSGWRW